MSTCQHNTQGWCRRCYVREYRKRALTGNPGGLGVPKSEAVIAGRLDDFAWLLKTSSAGRLELARRLGVSVRTLTRYRSRLTSPTNPPPSQRGAA